VCVYNVNIIAVLNYETDVDLKFGAENVHKINKYQVITLTYSLLFCDSCSNKKYTRVLTNIQVKLKSHLVNLIFVCDFDHICLHLCSFDL